jgi:hypothetical protein
MHAITAGADIDVKIAIMLKPAAESAPPPSAPRMPSFAAMTNSRWATWG